VKRLREGNGKDVALVRIERLSLKRERLKS